MPLASSSYSYPLLGAFWTIFLIFLWVVWFWVLIWVFIDIFRSRDLSGWAKALWFVFVLFIPLIGVLVYLIARGGSMQDRAAQQAQQQDQEFRSYVHDAAGGHSRRPAGQAGRPARPRGHLRRGVRPREGQAAGGLTCPAHLRQCERRRLQASRTQRPGHPGPDHPLRGNTAGPVPEGGHDIERAG